MRRERRGRIKDKGSPQGADVPRGNAKNIRQGNKPWWKGGATRRGRWWEGAGVLAFALAAGGAGKDVVARQGLGWLGATPQAASGSTSIV